MLKMLRSTRIGYYVTSITGAFAIIFWQLFINNNVGMAIALAFLWILIMATIFSIVAAKRIRKINTYLYNECKPQKFVEEMEKLYNQQTEEGNKNTIRISLSAGNIDAGNLERGKQYLDQVTPLSVKKYVDVLRQIVFFNNRATYYMRTGQLMEAEMDLACMQEVLKTKKLFEKNRRKYMDAYEYKKVQLGIISNQFDGAEKILKIGLEREKSMLSQVSFRYYLGLVYLHEQKMTEARECFTFVVEHGGTTWYVGMAKEKLKECI